MTADEVRTLMQGVAALMKPLVARIEALEQRGAWAPGKHYAAGSLCTFRGVTWRCLQPHSAGETPEDGDTWRAVSS